jgi:hypothetical protein
VIVVSNVSSSQKGRSAETITGIPEMEEKARALREHVSTAGDNFASNLPFDRAYSKEERIELEIRALLQPVFQDILSNQPPPDEIQALAEVILGGVYPLFFSRQGLQVEEKQESKEGGWCSVQ